MLARNRDTRSQWQCSNCGSTETKKRAKGLCQKCYHKQYKHLHHERTLEHQRAYYRRHKESFIAKISAKRRQMRLKMIEALGGQCVCCGEKSKEFLCLDHIKGGGRREYKKKARHQIWRAAMKEGLPRDRYRLLCWNCNSSLGLYGYCPHSDLTSPTFHEKHKNSFTLNA